jgi:hypothetical protein
MAAIWSLSVFQLTFRVAEPEGLARRLPPLANGVTDQGLGGRNEVTGAGNLVLAAVQPSSDLQFPLKPLAVPMTMSKKTRSYL